VSVTAIPTVLDGRRYRSRLEARWAAVFDRLGWPYEYEPVDLEGYIPDFVLGFYRPLLVEVKPILVFEDFLGHIGKIERAGWDGEALLVGARLFEGSVLGMLGERLDGDWEWDAAMAMRCRQCGRPSLYHRSVGWQCRVEGCYVGNGHVAEPGEVFADAWLEAGNVVQWRGDT
jgi:hypothetical protein